MKTPALPPLDAATAKPETSDTLRERLEAARTARTTAANKLTEIEVLCDVLDGADPSLVSQRDEAQRRVSLLDERVQALEEVYATALKAEEIAAAEAKAAAIEAARTTAHNKLEKATALAVEAHAELVAAALKAREAVALCAEAREAAWRGVQLIGSRAIHSAGHVAQVPDLNGPITELVQDVYGQRFRVSPEDVDLGHYMRVAARQIEGRLAPEAQATAEPAPNLGAPTTDPAPEVTQGKSSQVRRSPKWLLTLPAEGQTHER